ncbi:MAG: FAD-dependent oxidoreductase [Chitinophagaceae bacterium]|nr:FAD-dependent oxidoreductase [Chitinophagaceae bacterium]
MVVDHGAGIRELRTERVSVDVVVVGGGLSGVCAALSAARAGVSVALVQDRPVLGGNASSEVRLWVLGATSHMGNNNRWAREGGILDEILIENLYRNREGNPLILDTILLEKVSAEPNIRLMLNTCVHEAAMRDACTIASVTAFCSQNQTRYVLDGVQFIDASGDGILGFLSGAAFRMGAESASEFGERFAPDADYGELLGHSIYFYTKDAGVPVKYHAPSFALQDITAIPRFRSFNARDHGCRLWWIEYGGRMDTIRDSERIKWELWRVVYGVWHHIKNSGQFPEAENLTLEWVGTIPGKRESRRFEGDHMLRQQDIVEQRVHEDVVAFGGWSIDLHPGDGVYSPLPGCNQWHSKGIYGIPYRCLYSRNVSNLFLAGRLISASHVAFGSTRVMATGSAVGQAVGTAAAICIREGSMPRDLCDASHMNLLQQSLLQAGVFLPGVRRNDPADLSLSARLQASSSLMFSGFPQDSDWQVLDCSIAQMVPVHAGSIPGVTFELLSSVETELTVQWRMSDRPDNQTPEIILHEQIFSLKAGVGQLFFECNQSLQDDRYLYLVLLRNESVSVPLSNMRVSGILSLVNHINVAVSNYGRQSPPEGIGFDAFEFWCPRRRPGGRNLAITLNNGIPVFGSDNLCNGVDRPHIMPNAWVANPDDPSPFIRLEWDEPQLIGSMELCFDNDFDHPLESVLMGHPEDRMPFCVRDLNVSDDRGNAIAFLRDNHETVRYIHLAEPVETRALTIALSHPSAHVPAALFAVRCFKP